MFTTDTLSGKNILVTGGGSGLGLAMAKMFSSLGASVAICGRNEAKLQAAVQEIGSGALYAVCDVRDHEAVGAMIADLDARMGGVNGLVNNAAGNFLSASEDLSPNAFNTVVDIVLKGTFNCTQHFGKLVIANKRPDAVVLNIVTTYTETGSAFVLPSACAKAGVYALTNSLAMEWATYGIRLNAIAPGPFPTEGAWSRLLPDKSIEEKYLKGIPAGRYGKHEELGWLATFLMSDMSAYITGECVTIDGGERLQAGQFNLFANMFPREQLRAFFGMLKGNRK
ncbi:MAG: SDR family oxidoreductase [Bacteroidia bacterium]